LDVGDPSPSEAAEAFTRWRADGWGETRAHAKPVRDFLIRGTLAVAKAHDRAFHFHCGGGDPDIDLEHASPKGLFPLLVDVQHQPVVLVHSGFPWVEEGAFIASVLPNVYLELSELIPWGWGQVEPALDLIVGSVPAAKIMYGSDEAGEPEGFWVAALMARAALQRVLGRLVEGGHGAGGGGPPLPPPSARPPRGPPPRGAHPRR
jgi:predicted TIM-barrel fold metal-dependent hydrolase